MTRYTTALDDYFHLIVRTRPWTKKEDEALLAAFGDWLEARSVEHLAEITPALIRAYVQDVRLDSGEEQAFYVALRRLYTWSEWQGLVPAETLSLLPEAGGAPVEGPGGP